MKNSIKTKRAIGSGFKRGLLTGVPLWTFVAATLLWGCSQEESPTPAGDGEVVVSFTAGKQALAVAPIGTSHGESWNIGDKVGIFMEGANGTSAHNREYNVNPSTGELTPEDGNPLYYPQKGTTDFIAYYPYSGAIGTGPGQIDNYRYHLTVAGQTSEAAQNALNVMYAKATNVERSKTVPVNFTFGHTLSKITVNLTAGSGITSSDIQQLAATAVELREMPLTATLDLQSGILAAGGTGNFSPLKVATATGSDATFSALIVPQVANTYSSRAIVFTVGSEDYTWQIPDEHDFAAGSHYTYPMTIKRSGITVGPPTITPWIPSDNGVGEIDNPLPGLVLIPKGTFLMGSPESEPNRISNETQHRVTLTKDFYMSKYPVTFTEYGAFCEATGRTKPDDYGWGRGNRPVINVSWADATAYCEWMSIHSWIAQRTGMNCRLPTEAEWEYACRGGQSESLPFGIGDGKKLDGDRANIDGRFAYDYDNGGEQEYNALGTFLGGTSPVGSYPYPNGFGLYDMHGNVFEWCSDWYDAYDSHSVVDPTGPSTGYFRVLRGGRWSNDAQNCRSAFRYSSTPELASRYYGFRVVFVP